MAAILALLLVFAGNLQHTEATAIYSVVAPRVLRPNRDYFVVVSTHGTSGTTRFTLDVAGVQDVGGTVVNRQTVDLEPDMSQTVKFQIGEPGPGQYNLTVSGQGGGLDFANSTELEYVAKSYSVFLETDRGLYKPGDLVRFRVLVLNPHLRPTVTGAIDVFVTDGEGNRVKQWTRVFTNKGVWTGELQLSSEPVLGTWNITVDVLGQKTRASFLVAIYVLPKFEVVVDLPPYATFQDDQIVVTVSANYPYGRPVKGEVTLQVSPTYRYGYLQAPYDDPVSVVKQMKGKTDIVLHLKDDLKLATDYARELQFTAYVNEELTGRVQNGSAKTTVYKYPYRMDLIRTSDSFKPGLKYTAYLKLSYNDDSPVQSGSVLIRHAFSHEPEAFVERSYSVPPTGVVELDFYPPLHEDVTGLAIEAQYGDLKQWLAEVMRAQSPSNAFLQATLLTQKPKVGEEIVIGLNSTQPLVYFVYEVLGRGEIIFADTLQAHKGTTHTFRFAAHPAMSPRARLIIYYVKDDGEIVADSLHFAVEGILENELKLSVSPAVVDAGQDVSITVSTTPNSFVGLAAIDQRSLQLSDRNRLTEKMLLDELEDYDPGRVDVPSPWHMLQKRKKRALFNWHGTTTTGEVFKNAGVIVLSNGLVYDYNPMLPETVYDERPPAENGPYARGVPPLWATTVRPDLGPGLEYKAPTRPPLAGPYAYSFLPPPPDNLPRIYLSQRLPAPWVFQSAIAPRFNGVVSFQAKAPDSLTSYILSAFSVDEFNGLSITKDPSKLTIFRPFFASLHLPPFVLRDEAMAVEVVVFNYGDRDVTATVVLDNRDGHFLFPDFVNEIDQSSPASERSRDVTVKANSGGLVSFMVVPQGVGVVPVKITAKSAKAVDVVIKKLIVKPEGTRLTSNNVFLVDLRSGETVTNEVNITTPRNIVNGSLAVFVSAVGDVMGGAVQDLDNLLELPTGCGEQNMAKLIPNIVLVEYLKSKNQLDEALLGRARRNMETGYQRQLTFRHKDGSFSAFGEKDASGSTWLTAFVVKSLVSAARHIDVDGAVIQDGISWIVQQQSADGSFPEVGTINNKAIQGGATEGIPLTAFVLTSLMAYSSGSSDTKNAVNKGLDFLASIVNEIKDTYSLSLVSYCFHLASNPLRDTTFYALEAKATVEDDQKWWGAANPVVETVETTVSSTPLDIETTSYALLTYTIRSLAKDAIPVLRWLTAQRNQNGGFQSTQDTAVGLASLAALAELLSPQPPRANVRLVYGGRGQNIRIDPKNALVLQKSELPPDTDAVQLSSTGSGVILVQVTYHYNVHVTAPKPAFSLDPQMDLISDKNKLRLNVCTGYTSGNSSNMAVLDISLPSGYVVDNDLIPALYDFRGVRRVEKKEDESGLVLYFDFLTREEVCPTVGAYRVNKVAFQKPTPVRVYDYYDLSRQARQFYSPAPATLCDICDLGECDEESCREQIVELNRQRQEPDEYTGPPTRGDDSGSERGAYPIFCLLLLTTLVPFL